MNRTVLYVDDDKNDALIVKRALAKENLSAQFFNVGDGCDAADWLTGSGIYSDKSKYPQADLLIVDLRMPRNSGFDLMEFVQARRDLKKIPVIVYTDSDDPSDKQRAFALGANAYLCKGNGAKDLMVYVRSVVTSLPASEKTADDWKLND